MTTRRQSTYVLLAFTVLLVVSLYVARATRPEGVQTSLAWPAAGVATWFLHHLRHRGRRVRAVAAALIAASVFTVNLLTGGAPSLLVPFTVVLLGHAVIGAYALGRLLPAGRLDEPGHVLRVLAASALAGAMSGPVSALLTWWARGEPIASSMLLFGVRNAGATFAVLVIVLSLGPPHGWRQVLDRPRRGETALIGSALLATCVAVHTLSAGAPVLFLTLAVAVAVAVRVGVARAAVLAGATAVLSIGLTVAGQGAIAAVPDLQGQAVVLQAFVCALLFVTQSLATLQRARDELAAELAASLGLLRNLADSAPIGTVVAVRGDDGGWYLSEPNPALVRLLGTDPVGRRWGPLLHEDDRPDVRAALDGIAAGRAEAWQGEVRHTTADGHAVWTQLHVSRLSGHDQTTAVVAQITDISARRAEDDRLSHLAGHDPLTGLPNRSRLYTDLETLIRAPGPDLTVFFLDLDRFKSVNDTLGHEAGDLVLAQVGLALNDVIRPGDLVSRLGGDEFVVCCPGVGAELAPAVAERLRAAVAPALLVTGGDDLGVGVSIGWAVHRDGDDAPALLRRSDSAMYVAKHGSRHVGAQGRTISERRLASGRA